MEEIVEGPKPRPAWVRPIAVLAQFALALLLGYATFRLYTENNDFPPYYHPDETGKAQQILGMTPHNFNHPLLMLETANLKWQHDIATLPPGDPKREDIREAVLAGRWGSAVLASIGVTALAIAGWTGYGFVGLVLTGLIMALCGPLLVHAHYFKEDASLLAGIMVAILGTRMVISAPEEFSQLLATIVMGIGCGAAASGKYVGVAAVVPCLLTVCIARVPHAWTVPIRIIIFLFIATATVVMINYRAFLDWSSLQISEAAYEGMREEYRHGVSGHSGLTFDVPNPWCLRIAASEMMPHIWVFLALGLVWLLYRRRFTRWGFVVTAFLVTFAVELMYNTIPFPRYALPITVCAYFAASQLISWFVTDLKARSRFAGYAALGACVVTILMLQGRQALSLNDQFLNDSRQCAREWIAKNIPPGSVIAVDNYTALQYGGDPWRFPQQSNLTQQIQGSGFFAAESGETPQDLAARGFGYVAVAWASYGRFFEPGVHGQEGREDWFDQHRKFYEELFTKGEVVWSSNVPPRPATHSYVDNEIRIYKITKLNPSATADQNSGAKPQSGGLLRIFR